MKDGDRTKVAEEAAKLLYFNFVEDYKSAKEAACNSLGIKTLPSNFDVAMKLDELADKIEGKPRSEQLIDLRKIALRIMDELETFKPKLVGSVWRGTSRKGSDIDITVYSERVDTVVDLLRGKYDNVKSEYTSKTSAGVTIRFFHTYFSIPPGYDVEVVIRSPEVIHERYRCEIYGDYVVGLTRDQLHQLLERDAVKRFLPERKIGLKKRE
ncbi:MAG: nucleotidyltransferase domain-containing protein [Candidatus Bathyarchaeota archaeon]